MKTLAIALFGLLSTLSLFPQATVTWNTPSSPITTNDLQGNVGPISGVNAYRFGLYVGPTGSPESGLALVALTTNNSAAPGQFLPRSNVLLPMPAPTSVNFQVRGWSLFAGATYDEALAYGVANNSPLAFLGKSSLLTYTFGVAAMQSDAFVLTPIPEPGLLALGGVGALVMLLFRRRR